MIQELTEPEIKELLSKQWYGHLACHAEGKYPHLVPIAYMYDGTAIYSFSFLGEKITIMRKNPHVCFQVEKIFGDDMWMSVMVHGTYEELSGPERLQSIELLIRRLWDQEDGENALYMPFRDYPEAIERTMKTKGIVIFRIRIEHVSGRKERYD